MTDPDTSQETSTPDGRRRAAGVLSRRAWLAGLALLPAAARAATVKDADGQNVTIKDASRLITLGGDVTEIAYALGLGERVVAVDTTSLYPPAVEQLPKVGYLRQLGSEALLSLRPSAILASGDAGPPAVLRQLRDAGVPLLHMATSRRPEDVAEKISLIARAVDHEAAGTALRARFDSELAQARREVAAFADHPRCLFILSMNGGAPMAAGNHTAADAMIRLAGGVNVFGETQGYKAISPEVAAAAAPEVLLMMSQTLEGIGGAAAAAALPAIAVTPAGQKKRVAAIDGNFHLGFGPRLPAAISEIARRMRGMA